MPNAAPPAYDAADPSAYVANILALVDGRDPLALLEGGPARLADAVAGMSEADARACEAPGTWSVLEVLRHLADSEIVYGYRLRLVVAADRPALVGYDQDAWAERLAYHRGARPTRSASGGRGGRARSGSSAPSTTTPWDRVGLHSERGEESVRHIAALLAGHDLNHERQVRRVREALGR